MPSSLVHRKLRIGIAGYGFIGPVHVEVLRRLGYVDVAGLSHCNRERALEKAEQAGTLIVYGSFGEMVSESDIDVVHITMPNNRHYEEAKLAL